MQLRDFVQLSYALALPFIRKKILRGKLNLEIIGLQEKDVVHDCIADLFQQDEQGGFPQIRRFFEAHLDHIDTASAEELVSILRYLVFGKVNNNIIRLYSEADPILSKILRNLELALQRLQLFEQTTRFGETHLIPRGSNPLLSLPPIPMDFLEQEFCRVACINDKIPDMVRKLCSVLSTQEEYQRSVPLVSVALMFKRTYSHGWKAEEQAEVIDADFDNESVRKIAEEVWKNIYTQFSKTYVDSGKRSKDVFGCYMQAVRGILLSIEGLDGQAGESYFEFLKLQMPNLTKTAYRKEHRLVLEHMSKVAKRRFAEALRSLQ